MGNMLNIIMCDDCEKDRSKISKMVSEFFNKTNIEYEMHVFDDYNKDFDKIQQSKIAFKIYLLDIETPTKSGIDVAREIRQTDTDSVIIFLTGHEELGNIVLKNDLMFLSFINKFDNLKIRLNESLKKALGLLKQRRVIKITDKNILYTIDINDILYVVKENLERKTVIKTDYTEIKISKPLSEIIEMLDERFIQTHRACYINNDRKIKVDKSNRLVTFDTGDTIDLVSEKYKKRLV